MQELREYSSVSRWLGRLAESTQRVQHNFFNAFMEWMGEHGGAFKDMTPDELIEYQKNADNGSRYDMLDMVQQYIIEKPGTYNSKNSRYNNIRSFFMHNRAELPRDHFNINPEREPVKGDLSPDEIRRVILSSNSMYQAMFLSMFQGAMDQEMVTYWSANGYDNLVEHLKGDPEVVKVDLPGRKARKFKGEGYYTFIAGDAIKALRTWIKQRQHKVETGKIPRDSRAIFCNQYGETISKRTIREYWTAKLRRLGIIEPVKRGTKISRTGKGLHEMRDVFRSLWSKSPASHVVGEYCMGHQIDKLNYDKSFLDVKFYHAEYVKALPYLQLISQGEAFGRVDKTEVDRLRRENEELRSTMHTDMEALLARIKRLEQQREN